MSALEDNPLRTLGDGGPGFCYVANRDLYRGSGSLVDGPMLVGLDSNILFDLEKHGLALIEDELPDDLSDNELQELEGLQQVLDLWMVRDLRFIVVSRTRADFKRSPTAARLAERDQLFSRIEATLAFQLDGWGEAAEGAAWDRLPSAEAHAAFERIPSELDQLMVRSAWEAGVDIFVTRDLAVLKAQRDVPADYPLVLSPSGLAERLDGLGDDPFFLGMVDHEDCLWSHGLMFGDTGRWVTLFEAFSDD